MYIFLKNHIKFYIVGKLNKMTDYFEAIAMVSILHHISKTTAYLQNYLFEGFIFYNLC